MTDQTEPSSRSKEPRVKAPTTLGRRATDGAWITYARVITHEPADGEGKREYATHVVGIYPDKDAAGDAIIDAAGDEPITLRRVFVPWGMTVDDAIAQS